MEKVEQLILIPEQLDTLAITIARAGEVITKASHPLDRHWLEEEQIAIGQPIALRTSDPAKYNGKQLASGIDGHRRVFVSGDQCSKGTRHHRCRWRGRGPEIPIRLPPPEHAYAL